MNTDAFKHHRKKQKMYIKAYTVMCSILLVVVGLYTWQSWNEYSLIKDAVASNEKFIDVLGDEVASEQAKYDASRDSYDGLRKEIQTKLADIFPLGDKYTELTRQLDAYEKDLAKRNSLFEVSNIDFQQPIEGDLFSILPFRMTIRSSASNFRNFLHLVENSGSLSDQVRLMDVSSIRLNFQSDDDDQANNMINFSVQINAYYQ